MNTETQTETETTTPPHYPRWQAMRDEAVWTPAMRAFAKKATSAVLYFHKVSDAPSWVHDAAFVEIKLIRERRDSVEESMTVKFAGFIGTGRRDALRTVEPNADSYGWKEYSKEEHNLYRPTSGTWLLHLYPSQSTHAYSCFLAIPSGAKLVFYVKMDYHSSPAMAEHGLHGDVLVVEVSKGKHRSNFDLDTIATRHNSARFGYSHR